MQDRDADWHETFDDLLVFEQDFDTAMQILMFQDEKVARLSLEDSQQTRSQRARNRQEIYSTRGKTRSPGRKRRRVEQETSPRHKPPPFPTLQTREELTQFSTQSDNSLMPGSASNPGADIVGADRGVDAGTGVVASLFCTGSGKQVSISKAKLDAYERQMCEDASDLIAPPTTRSDGNAKQLASGTKVGSAGGRGGPGADIVGADRGVDAGTGVVASLFCTGSGKQVSISKAKLDAYERQMCEDASDLIAPPTTRSDGNAKQLASGTKVGSAGGRGGPGADIVGADRGVDAGTGVVASLFCTGSGKQVSISKAKLDAYERQMCEDASDLIAPPTTRSDGNAKQLASGTKVGSAGGRGGPGADIVGADRGVDAGTGVVASLFCTGSGKQVSISKAKLDAYERQMCEDASDLIAPPTTRSDGNAKQLASGTKVGSAGGRGGPGADIVGADRGVDAGTGVVASLFCTGSGKQVSISKAKLDAYERQMCEDDSDLIAPPTTRSDGNAKQLASGTKVGSAGGRGGPGADIVGADRGVDAGTGVVASLFCTGSGKQVSISKAKLDAYERQMCEDASDLIAPPTTRSDGNAKQLASGTKVGSAGGRGGPGADIVGADRGVDAGTGVVASLFCTGSGKQVSISKAKLDAYERQMCEDDSDLIAPPTTRSDGNAKQLASGTKVGSAGGRGGPGADIVGADRGVDAGTGVVASLFCTGSGKQVSISKAKLDAYERQMCEDASDLIAPPTTRSDGNAKQLASGTKVGSAGGRGGPGADIVGADRGVDAGTGVVASLFCTGSGKQVSISKATLDAYERQMYGDDSDVSAPSSIRMEGQIMKCGRELKDGFADYSLAQLHSSTTTSGVPQERQVVKGMVTKSAVKSAALTAGSGTVVISVSAQHICDEKPHRDNERRGGSGVEYTASSKNAVQAVSKEIVGDNVNEDTSTSLRLEKTGLAERNVLGKLRGTRDGRFRLSTPPNGSALLCRDRGASVPSYRFSDSAYPQTENRHHQSQRIDFGDKENVHPENVLVRKTAALEASKTWQSSARSMQLNVRQSLQQHARQQKRIQRALKPSIEPRSKMAGKKRFHPPVASKRLCASDFKDSQTIDNATVPRTKKQKVVGTEAQPFIYQESMKISLTALIGLHGVGGDFEQRRLQVLNSITAENALKVCFGQDDSLILFLDEAYDTTLFIGPRELYRQLRARRHILKKSGATFVWFLNHYRWIVWKLAAMERSFPRLLLANYLTKDQILKQITHRYQRDLNDAQRSIVKKILQRDASSLSCMVLCVAAVLPFSADGNNAADQELPACWNMALVLTDGWYSVYAVPDAPLAAVFWKLHAKSSLVGTKIATWNASLQNSTEGIDPLDCAIVRESEWRNPLMANEDLTQWPYLQLRYNSTRRVRFDTRLGVEKLHYVTLVNSRHRKQQPQVSFSLLKSVPMKSLEVGGGMVRSVRIRVTRISPVLHLQSKEWTLGPRILCEEQLPLYFQLRSEYAQAVMRKKCQRDDTSDDWVGDDQIDVPLPTPFIKVDVECTHNSFNGGQGIGCGILTIWRPSEDLLSGGLREGIDYYASSLTVNWKLDGGRGQDAFLRLSSTKHSGFEEIQEESLANNEIEDTTQQTRRQRVCVDVQQAIMDYRANFEVGINGRRNERRPTIDVCVCVVLVAARETQDVSSSTKKQADVSLLDLEIKPQESRYVEHVFVTDLSCHLMSIRVSGMDVSMSKKKNSTSPLKRLASSSFVFRRGSKNIWKEGAVLCLSGLEVSHYDEQLRVLDCVLVESTQIVSHPSKRSPFWDPFQLLQRDAGCSTTRNSVLKVSSTSIDFANELTQLKKYVEREILRMDFVPSQECNEHHVEVVEQERLTQDLQAHEEGERATVEGADESSITPSHLCWDAEVIKIMPLIGPNRFIFPHGVEALASVKMGTEVTTFRTVYLTREVMLSMQTLLHETSSDGATASNTALVQKITETLDKFKEQNVDYSLRFEVRQSTNERLINSWKPWERLHASYWMAVSVAAIPTAK